MDQPVSKVETLAARKTANRARYKRQFARNKPAPKSNRYPAVLVMWPQQRAACQIRGVPEYLQQVVRMTYGAKGTWGHGLQPNGTRKGPGIRPLPRLYRQGEDQPLVERDHPAGTKLTRRFIRTSSRESTFWRNRYANLTGKQYE